jgi:hypothetical protein
LNVKGLEGKAKGSGQKERAKIRRLSNPNLI